MQLAVRVTAQCRTTNPGYAFVNKRLVNEASILAVVFGRIVPNAFWSGCSCNHRLHPCYKQGGRTVSGGVAGWSDSSQHPCIVGGQCLEDSLAKPIMVEPNVTHHLLEDEQMVRLLTLIKDDPNCGMTLAAPKVTVLSGESAALSIQTQTVVALPPQVTGEALPEMLRPGTDRTIPSGITLNVTPIITPDKENILLNLNIQMNNFLGMKTYNFETPLPDGTVAKYEQELPQIETVSLQTRVSVPDGGTILLAGQKVKSKGEQDGQIVEKDLLILIKAEIVGVSWIDSNASPDGGGVIVNTNCIYSLRR